MDRECSIVIAHGSFSQAPLFDTFTSALKDVGFHRVIVPQLPSAGFSPPENPFERDVTTLQNATAKQLETHDVLLVAHSYGGLPGCEAIAEFPSTSPLAGRIRGIVLVAAVLADVGMSSLTCGNGEVIDWYRDEGAVWSVNNPEPVFFNLAEKDVARNAVKSVVPHAPLSFMEPMKHAGWRDLPCVYIKCLQDNALSPTLQDHFIKRLRSGCSEEPTVLELDSDHFPMVSMPDKLAGIVKSAFKAD